MRVVVSCVNTWSGKSVGDSLARSPFRPVLEQQPDLIHGWSRGKARVLPVNGTTHVVVPICRPDPNCNEHEDDWPIVDIETANRDYRIGQNVHDAFRDLDAHLAGRKPEHLEFWLPDVDSDDLLELLTVLSRVKRDRPYFVYRSTRYEGEHCETNGA